MLKLHDDYNAGPYTSEDIREKREAREAEQRKRERLERNRQRAQAEPTYTPYDIRQFDKAVSKRSNPRLSPEKREEAARAVKSVEESIRVRREQHWIKTAIDETIALESERGGKISRRQDGGARRVDLPRDPGPGLQWLWDNNKLTLSQLLAGSQYGADFHEAHASLSSFLGNPIKTVGQTPGLPKENDAGLRLERARLRGLYGDPEFKAICDDVCGRGLALGELPEAKRCNGGRDSAKVAMLRERLKHALNFLALFYSIAPDMRTRGEL